MPVEGVVRGMKRAVRVALVCNIVLVVALVISWVADLGVPRAARAHSEFDGFDRNAGIAHGSIDSATVDRAIYGKAVFRTARAVEEKIVDELGRYQLMGVSVGPAGTSAFVKDTARKQTLSVSPGEQLGVQFEVVSIDQDGVVLRRGGETLRLTR